MRFFRIIISSCLLLVMAPAMAAPVLPALGADAKRVSVSGLSSGGFMAVQYAVAFSGSTIGAGIVAGGPYGCAGIYLAAFLSVCMEGKPEGATSFRAAKQFAEGGVIDPIAGLKAQRIYLFSGTKDAVVHQTVMNGLRDFYKAAHVAPANLLYVKNFPAGHAFISADTGNADCGANGGHYINQCASGGADYDQPQAILQHIYGPLKPKAAALPNKPIAFDQTPFTGSLSSMASTGYVYIPAACKDGSAHCAVHVVFHGCLQSADKIGDDVYAKVGYNDWAETNGIIVLYPQVDAGLLPINPQGCWDWWGYTGSSFQFRSGVQLKAVHAMVARLEQAP